MEKLSGRKCDACEISIEHCKNWIIPNKLKGFEYNEPCSICNKKNEKQKSLNLRKTAEIKYFFKDLNWKIRKM
jgi:hypothetical protein